MSAIERLRMLSNQMHLEPAEDATCPQYSVRKQDAVNISTAQLPNGRQIKLLKTLLTSTCERDCYYCPFRAGRDFRRASFKPDEFARLFAYIHQTGAASGLFLSSGLVNGGLQTQDQLIATAEILRRQHHFRGYIHLKIMPGADREQVLRAMQLADRVSVNLEAPNAARLERLAPRKTFFEELLQPLLWAQEIRQSLPGSQGWNGHWPSTVTQYVVGGSDESDVELLATTEQLHRQAGLARAYFSAFSPVSDTPLENKAPTPALRQHRLYQASFLLRDYGFNLEEMPFGEQGNLALDEDPKTSWARANLLEPVDINLASPELLLRIPGIGPKGSKAILAARQQRTLRDLSALTRLGIRAQKAAPFILLDGKRPAQQLALF
ncbi:MAG: radical SAM protein [Anaerolineales bacterium]|nr:radical SAM protein [Anaerolineales bacterium]